MNSHCLFFQFIAHTENLSLCDYNHRFYYQNQKTSKHYKRTLQPIVITLSEAQLYSLGYKYFEIAIQKKYMLNIQINQYTSTLKKSSILTFETCQTYKCIALY